MHNWQKTSEIIKEKVFICKYIVLQMMNRMKFKFHTFRRLTTILLLSGIFCTTAKAQRAYINHNLDNKITVLDITTRELIAEIPIGRGSVGIAPLPDTSKLYVCNSDDGNLSIINTEDNTETGLIQTEPTPFAVASSPDGKRIYVTNNFVEKLSVINTETDQFVGSLSVGRSPQGVAVHPSNGKVYVSNGFDGHIDIVDGMSMTLDTSIRMGFSLSGMCFARDGQKVYILDNGGSLFIFDTVSLTVDEEIDIRSFAKIIVLNPDETKAFVCHSFSGFVSIINLVTKTVEKEIKVGNTPSSLDITPDGSEVWVANTDDNTISIIDTETETVIETIDSGGERPYPVGRFILDKAVISSVKEDDLSFDNLRVFPNPASEFIFIESTGPYTGASLRIRNMQGQIMFTEQLDGAGLAIPVVKWPKGLFHLDISDYKERTVSRIISIH